MQVYRLASWLHELSNGASIDFRPVRTAAVVTVGHPTSTTTARIYLARRSSRLGRCCYSEAKTRRSAGRYYE